VNGRLPPASPSRFLLGSILIALLGGCGPSSADERWTVSDSAGVRIVESDISDLPILGELEMVVSLGTIGAGGPEEFYQVRDIELLDSTRIAVADGASEEVRIFRLDGTFLTSFGGEGHGPREFRGLSLIEDVADSIFTYDSGNDRIAVRNRSGEFVRSYRLEWFGGLVFPVEIGQDGSALAVTASHMTELQGVGRIVDQSLVSTYDAVGALVDSLRRIPHNERFVRQVGDRRTTVRAPFTAEASLVRFGSGFCHAFGPHPEVHCYGQVGDLKGIWRLSLRPRPVTEADIDAYWSTLRDEAEGPYREVMLRIRDAITFPDAMPAFSAALVEDDGVLWARKYDPTADGTGTWWLFDSEGRVTGQLKTPAGLEIMDVGSGLIAGVWRDELGVEHVRVYRR
jgi:hypothetical protein